MVKKTPKAEPISYKLIAGNLNSMTEAQLRIAIKDELTRKEPRVDLLKRMVSRFNRLRGARTMLGVMGLLSYKGKRDVDAVMDHRP